MEYDKIKDLIELSELPCKYTSKYLIEVNSDPRSKYNTKFQFEIATVKLGFCDYNYTYIFVTRTTPVFMKRKREMYHIKKFCSLYWLYYRNNTQIDYFENLDNLKRCMRFIRIE